MPQEALSEKAFDEVIDGARRDLEQGQQTYARYKRTQKKLWEDLAGAGVDEWLQNRQAAAAHLSDPNPKRRLTALSILLHHWKPDDALAAASETMALTDPDSQVREIALIALRACYHGSNNARIGKLLADIVKDGSRPESVRKIAYAGLFQVRGLPIESWPELKAIRLDHDVDWSFVQGFLV
jgi:hypothetical protein